MKQVFSFLLFLISIICTADIVKAQGGIIITVAGMDTTGGYSGDGSAATKARLNGPTGVAIDPAGNIYIADVFNNRIRKVDASGAIITIAGNGKAAYGGDGGAATNASLNEPTGVAVDNAGNIYIADNLNSVIRKVDTGGIISTIAGNYLLDVADGGGYSGDGGAATAAALYFPTGVCVDDTGNVYIADENNEVVRKVNTSGVITTIAGNHLLDAIPGLGGYSGDGGPATNAELYTPEGVSVDALGNIYIADANNNVIRKVNTAGIITTIAGDYSIGGSYAGDGGAATNAALYYPTGITIDAAGNIYIADDNNSVVRMVDKSGIITTIAGDSTLGYGFSGDGGPATAAQLKQPFGLTVDTAGNIYIADDANEDIRKVTRDLKASVNNIQPLADVLIYPNPANETLTIKTNVRAYTSFIISNSIGEVILARQITTPQTEVNVKTLPPGVYYIILKGYNGVMVRKILKD